MTAALAKASAGGRRARSRAHCQQVLAGIGFTTDHPFHRYLKRTLVLEGVLGGADDLVTDARPHAHRDPHRPHPRRPLSVDAFTRHVFRVE